MMQTERHRPAALDAAARVFGEPRWFPVDLDTHTGAIEFADIGSAWPKWQDFLDIAAGNKRVAKTSVPAAAAFKFAAENAFPPRLNFIWHTSYCCSTAIAAALDVPGRNLSIFEPQILISVANARRQAHRMERGDISWLSGAVFRLLRRSGPENMAVTLKPAPTANYLVPDAVARTGGKMLFLYSDCRSFLLACLRYGENRRRFVRQLFNEIRHDGDSAGRWTAESIAELTDLEIAGLTWQLQIERFAGHIRHLGDRAASLDCDVFLSRPAETIVRIWKFLELPGDAAESEAVHDPLFVERHAKYPGEPFSPAARLSADDGLDPRIREDVDRIAEVSTALLPDAANALPLPRALATMEKAYRR